MAAKTATLEELLSALASQSGRIQSLSASSIKASYTSGKPDSGKLQAYRSAPGYILLRRPDQIRMNIQNPLTKTSLVELSSARDSFSAWVPRDNKFYTGSNSSREFELEGHAGFSARPMHIFEAILPQTVAPDEPGTFVSLEEDRDDLAKYYILTFFKTGGSKRLLPLRKLWVDRSDLTVVRQRVYDETGQVVSLIQYSRMAPMDGMHLPLSIHIERPLDGYSLDLQIANWRLNPVLPDDAFILKPPEGAQIIQLKEKGRSAIS